MPDDKGMKIMKSTKRIVFVAMILSMLFGLVACGKAKSNPVSGTDVNKEQESNSVADDTKSKNDEAKLDGKTSNTNDTLKNEMSVIINDKEVVIPDVKDETEKQKDKNDVKIEYKTIELKDIFNEGSIAYYDCVDYVIDDVQFKIPDDSDNFFISADFSVRKEDIDGFEEIFVAGKYITYMKRYNATTYYIIFNTETDYGIEFGHVMSYKNEKTFNKVLETFNEALEDYMSEKYQ